jgi:tetratricopeptide (TPR) repeat protein
MSWLRRPRLSLKLQPSGGRGTTGTLVDEIIAARSAFESVSPDAWYDRLERESDELQAALRRLCETDVQAGLELAGIIWPYWVARGRLAEGRSWLTDVLARTAAEPRTPERTNALYGAAVVAFLQGESDLARRLLLETLAAARGLGSHKTEADALIGLARIAMSERDPLAMEERALESAEAARSGGDERRYATALHHVAEALRRQGRHDEALPFYRDAIERHRALGDRRSVALELHNLGRLARLTGDPGSAARRFRESLVLAAELKHERLVAYCLLGLAMLAADDGDIRRAVGLVGAADARLAAVGAALEPEYADEREKMLKRGERALEGHECAVEHAAGSALGLEESVQAGLEGDAQPR